MSDSLLSLEQVARLNMLVRRAYRRMYHDWRPLSPAWALKVLDWTLDTREGRETYAWAARVVTGQEKENPYD
jgi:hypothetical protein